MSRIRPCIAENFQNKVACIHDYSGFKSKYVRAMQIELHAIADAVSFLLL